MKKEVVLDSRAYKDIKRFPRQVQMRFRSLYKLLTKYGKLREPYSKKLIGHENLYELRVKYQGEWRAMYAYLGEERIIILNAFKKTTQKTPFNHIKTSLQRLRSF